MSEDKQNETVETVRNNSQGDRASGFRGGQDRDRGSQDRDGQDRGSGMRSRRTFYKKKVCKFCKSNLEVDYKKSDSLRRFITERGKILPRRITGTCAKHQRKLTTEIKRSRALALLPFVSK